MNTYWLTLIGLTVAFADATRTLEPESDAAPQSYAIPDTRKVVLDGTDDAPSIQRAVNTRLPVHFRCRHYSIESPVHIIVLTTLKGCGAATDQVTKDFGNSGTTWFDIGQQFIIANGSGTNASTIVGSYHTQHPFTFDGNAAAGSVIEDVAVKEAQAHPNPTDAVWAPNTVPAIFWAHKTEGDITFRNILFWGVYEGVLSESSGRTNLFNIKGKIFHSLLQLDASYDVSRIDHIHLWTYWDSGVPVLQWQQAHEDSLVLGRVDSPLIDHFFSFASRSGLRFVHTRNGETSGAMLGMIQCDFTQYCLWADDSTTNVTLQADSIRSYTQKWTGTAQNAPLQFLNHGTVINVDGRLLMANIGSIVDYGSNECSICMNNVRLPSDITVGAVFVANVNDQASQSSLVKMATISGTPHLLQIATAPQVLGVRPPGYAYLNSGSNGVVRIPSQVNASGAP